ncbi:Bacterial hemoglobin [Acaryochloris thomasi RCC1774]|uniref:Bacterial hemoglobin n=2 Tax=Acaryochloris TaxID=155977 RepID=A0A2W1JHN3_9CYAN|nr:Bacterial hemoglobin [Acaryochloris thomasi RCC1774]
MLLACVPLSLRTYRNSPMNIELLERSFEQIRPQAIAFSNHFYETLFRHNPGIKPLFANISQQAQGKKLIFSLAAIIENLRSPEVLEPALKSLGARHFEVGTLEEHYPLVGQALFETFAAYLGSDWTPATMDAWQEAYEAIATIMLEGAQNPQAHLEPELTFYDWVDLYGEGSPKVKDAIFSLTNFQYGKTS